MNYKDFYNQFADRYEKLFQQGDMFFHEKIQKPLLDEYIGNRMFKNVLDVGCGFGFYTEHLANSAGRIIGVDISDEMIGIANIKSAKQNVFYECKDILEFEKEYSFDLIFAGFMPSYFSDLSGIFQHLHKLCSHGGELIVTMLHPIRMASTKRTENGYLVENYLATGFYESDFLSMRTPLLLHKHQFGKVFNAAKNAGFKMMRIDEPSVSLESTNNSVEDFYRYNPSIIGYRMIKEELEDA